ncbi:hypothetical protein HID58_074379, partial [Brassica napus]
NSSLQSQDAMVDMEESERCIGGYGFNCVCGGYDDGGRAMDVVMKELMVITKEVMIATEEEVVVEETVEEQVAVLLEWRYTGDSVYEASGGRGSRVNRDCRYREVFHSID